LSLLNWTCFPERQRRVRNREWDIRDDDMRACWMIYLLHFKQAFWWDHLGILSEVVLMINDIQVEMCRVDHDL
jgi:hypothetical protein